WSSSSFATAPDITPAAAVDRAIVRAGGRTCGRSSNRTAAVQRAKPCWQGSRGRCRPERPPVASAVAFADQYAPETPAIDGDDAALRPWAERASGLLAFMHRYSGCTFGGGIYRVHALSEVGTWTRNCEEAFPAFQNRV